MTQRLQRFAHQDGRKWSIRASEQANGSGAVVEIQIVMDDGESIERTLRFGNIATAEGEVAEMIALQRADGFAEIDDEDDKPDASILDLLAQRWRKADPTFEIEPWLSFIQALKTPPLGEALGALENLRRVGQPEGTAAKMLFEGFGQELLPMLLLALRHPDDHACHVVHGLLVDRLGAPKEALAAVLSAMQFNWATTDGQAHPAEVLGAMGPPEPQTIERLITMLDSSEWVVQAAAARAIAKLTDCDPLFEALLTKLDAAKDIDEMAWSVLSVADARPDRRLRPFITWMRNSRRFRGAGYPKSIREVLDKQPA